MRAPALLFAFALVAPGCQTGEGYALEGSRSSRHAPLPPPVSTEPSVWPNALPRELEIPASNGGRRVVVYLDAGHGADKNEGNTSSFCVAEQDFTKALADDVAAELEATGRFQVIPSRVGGEKIPYVERVELARLLEADVFVSLHSDVRGKSETWSPDAGMSCLRSFDAPGFSVLFSDEPGPASAPDRERLATSIAGSLADAGFTAYGGREYEGLYGRIGEGSGVFVDRHEHDKRIFVLRRTAMPAVIVETHNALDPREAEAFEDPCVRHAFALALGRGLLDYMP